MVFIVIVVAAAIMCCHLCINLVLCLKSDRCSLLLKFRRYYSNQSVQHKSRSGAFTRLLLLMIFAG